MGTQSRFYLCIAGKISDDQSVPDVHKVQTVQKNENSSLNVLCAVSSGTTSGPVMVAIPVSSHLPSDSITTYHNEDLHQHAGNKTGEYHLLLYNIIYIYMNIYSLTCDKDHLCKVIPCL